MKKYHKIKITSLLGGLFGGIALPLLGLTNVSAWGPDRDTFTMAEPAEYPVFNSITDNPTIGDEREFVKIGEIDANITTASDEVEIVPGHQYVVYIYFHNNASSTFNSSTYNYSGIATGVRMSSSFSTILTPQSEGQITATITADNTDPESVWDEARMTTATDMVALRYISGSAKIYNDFETNNTGMPSSLFTEEGAYLTLNSAAIGAIPGCEEYHGVVSYVLEASELKGTMNKTVSTDGVNYSESLENIHAGDTLYYKILIKNEGDLELTNATIKDSLPTGIDFVPGSVKLTANDSGVQDSLSDNLFTDGYNLGTIGTGNAIEITYQATVSGNYDCKGTNLANLATFVYDNTDASGVSVEDSVNVQAIKADCDDCVNNPDLEGCSELPNTGPLEIAMAAVVVIGIGGGGYYFYRTRKNLHKVASAAAGNSGIGSTPNAPMTSTDMDAPYSNHYSAPINQAPTAPQTPEQPLQTPEQLPQTPVVPEIPTTPTVTPEAPVAPETPATPEPSITSELPTTPETPQDPNQPQA